MIVSVDGAELDYTTQGRGPAWIDAYGRYDDAVPYLAWEGLAATNRSSRSRRASRRSWRIGFRERGD